MRPGPCLRSAFTRTVARFLPWCIPCALTACVLLSGCKRAETPRPATPAPSPTAVDASKLPDIAGSYTLVSINGTPLPFTVTHEGPGIQVTSGTFTIRPDGTCATVTAFVMPSGQAQSREVSISCLALYTKLPGGRCLTHVGREGTALVLLHPLQRRERVGAFDHPLHQPVVAS